MRRSNFRWGVILVAVLGIIVSACGQADGRRSTAPEVEAGPVPFMIGSANPAGATFNGGLAFLNPAVFSTNEISSIGVVFRTDGTWSALPAPPLNPVSASLGTSSDGRLVLAAIECERCVQGARRVFILNENETVWLEQGKAVEIARKDAGMSNVPGLGATVFSTDLGNFTLVNGRVVDVPFTPDRALGGATVCASNNFMFALQSATLDLEDGIETGKITEKLSSAHVLDRSTREWIRIELPPGGAELVGRGVCSSAGAVFLSSGVEYDYSVSGNEWTTSQTALDGSLAGLDVIIGSRTRRQVVCDS